jgi:hypothetical protein
MQKKILIFFQIILFNVLCIGQTPYIPSINANIDSNTYKKYTHLFVSNYKENKVKPDFSNTINLFATFLNLYAPVDSTHKYALNALKYYPIETCHHWFKTEAIFMYKEDVKKKYSMTKVAELKCKCDTIWKNLDSTLIRKLDIIRRKDNKYRDNPNDAPWIKGNELKWKEQTLLDSINQVEILKIIKEKGYPGRNKIGDDLDQIAFLVIQHGDLAYQEKNLTVIEKACKEGQLNKSCYPMLLDRILMRKSLPQIYGTQLVFNDKKERMELYKIATLKGIDELRKEQGLGTLKDYLKFNQAYIPDEFNKK